MTDKNIIWIIERIRKAREPLSNATSKEMATAHNALLDAEEYITKQAGLLGIISEMCKEGAQNPNNFLLPLAGESIGRELAKT